MELVCIQLQSLVSLSLNNHTAIVAICSLSLSKDHQINIV
jgi:hypothetical protein